MSLQSSVPIDGKPTAMVGISLKMLCDILENTVLLKILGSIRTLFHFHPNMKKVGNRRFCYPYRFTRRSEVLSTTTLPAWLEQQEQ